MTQPIIQPVPELDLAALKADYDRDGFIAITPLFTADEMAALNAELDRFIAEDVPDMPSERAFYEEKGNKGTLKQAFHLQDYSPYLKALSQEGRLRQLASAMFGEEAVPMGVEYFNKPAGIGKPTPPHQDGYYFKLVPCVALTCWLALEPVDDENGCIHYVKGSHQGTGFRPHGRSEILGFSMGITDFGTEADKAGTVACPGPAGTFLMHDARTIHWAGANVSPSRSRRALGFVYNGVSARKDEEAAARYKADLDAQLRAKEAI